MTRLTRPDLDALPAYIPGRNPADLARELGLPDAVKLASNEVPYGPLPGVTEAIVAAAAGVDRYPDPGVVQLREALAQRYEIDPDRIVTGCGSASLCELLARSTTLPGDQIMYAWRSFEMYPILTITTGATAVPIPNTPEHEHDLDAMADAVTDRTRLIFVCNPNNPTGTAIRHAALERFLDRVPESVLVVIDEAYREFVTDPEVPDALKSFIDRPNVAVVRTFSKAWGLAGLRVGWLVAPPEVVTAVRKVITPFSTNSVGQAAALAALNATDEMRRRVALVLAERDRVLKAVRELVPGVPDSQANFIWLPLGDQAIDFARACESRAVIVRAFAGHGVRVTIGTPEENDAFLAVAADALS